MRKTRYYAESDGGGCGNLVQPKTFYVVDSEGEQDRIDCESWSAALKLAHELNEAEEEKRYIRQMRKEGRLDNTAIVPTIPPEKRSLS